MVSRQRDKRRNKKAPVMNSEFRKMPWTVYPYENRKLTRKISDTLKEINVLKNDGDWIAASKLQWTLRNAWWGFKRYKN